MLIQCRLDFWSLKVGFRRTTNQEKLSISNSILAGWRQTTCQWPMETKPRLRYKKKRKYQAKHLIQGKFIELVRYFNNQGNIIDIWLQLHHMDSNVRRDFLGHIGNSTSLLWGYISWSSWLMKHSHCTIDRYMSECAPQASEVGIVKYLAVWLNKIGTMDNLISQPYPVTRNPSKGL